MLIQNRSKIEFDFEKFSHITSKVHESINSPYSIEQVLQVFWIYFSTYERYIGNPHPPIKEGQIRRIINKMPCTGNFDIYPEDYEALIKKHFETQYKYGCDYNINHFFSGEIRELRFYEELY